MWFHTTSLVTSIIPLAVGIPDFPVIPNLTACLVLLAIGFTSFIGQLFLGRSYQIGSAGRISAIDYTQVSPLSADVIMNDMILVMSDQGLDSALIRLVSKLMAAAVCSPGCSIMVCPNTLLELGHSCLMCLGTDRSAEIGVLLQVLMHPFIASCLCRGSACVSGSTKACARCICLLGMRLLLPVCCCGKACSKGFHTLQTAEQIYEPTAMHVSDQRSCRRC